MSDKLDVSCPKCDHQKLISIEELRRNPTFICCKCGARITIDAGKFFAVLNERSPVPQKQKKVGNL